MVGGDELLELAAAAEATDLGAAAPDILEETVELACSRYTRTAPAQLLTDVRQLAAQVNVLLAQRATLAQRRRPGGRVCTRRFGGGVGRWWSWVRYGSRWGIGAPWS